MVIENHVPVNPQLKKHIECFFIIEHLPHEPPERFLILPSVDTYLSVSLNTVTHNKEEVIITEASQVASVDCSVQNGLRLPAFFEYRGSVKELCIRFKPMGLKHFSGEIQANSDKHFRPSKNFEATFKQLLTLNNNNNIFTAVEDYLLSIYIGFNHKYIFSVMDDLKALDNDKKNDLEIIGKKYGVSRQTLTKEFKKHTSFTPSEFRQIGRFRKFIETKLLDKNKSSLTEIVYDTGFFDQSHLIKYFRKYSFLHPMEFFRKLEHSDNNKVMLIWQ